MAGLIGELDATFEGGTFSASIDLQVEGLNEIIAAVEALLDGPPDLAELQTAISALPLPPGLAALGDLPVQIGALADGFEIGDTDALLQPILGPLATIGGPGFSLAGVANIKGAICLVQRVLALVTGQSFTDADGLPLPSALWGRQGFFTVEEMSPEDVRERVAELEAQLDTLGPRLNGPRFVELLRRLGPRWDEMQNWPHVPVATDVMEIAGVAVRWNAMDGAQLTTELDERLAEIERLIAMPKTRVADPLIAQAEAAATLPGAVAGFVTDGLPALERVAARARTGAKPTHGDLVQLERAVEALAPATEALSLGSGRPLGRLDDLVADLELHLLRAVRTMVPPYDVSALTDWIDGFVEAIPEPVAEPLEEAVTAVADLDLSFLTDPLSAVTEAVQRAVDSVEGAMADVSDAISGLVSPLADGLDAALEASGLNDVQDELASLPATIQAFVNDEIEPAVAPIRDAVAAAVETVSTGADEFSPEAIIAPLREAIEEVAALINTDEVAAVVGEVQLALEAATEAIIELDFGGAADEAISLLNEIEAKLAELDPIELPEPALELAEQAVSVVADIDFTAEVATPIVEEVSEALAAGPAEALAALRAGVDELRLSLERFRPSVAVGEALDRPFSEMLAALEDFAPSDLLNEISELLRSALDSVNVVDPSVVIGPLTEVHARLAAAVESARPSTLVAPIDAAIAGAIARLFEISGIDDVFDGIDDVMTTIREWVELVHETRTVLQRVAELLSDPGDVDEALDELVRSIVDRLDLADLDALAPRFESLGATVRSVERAQLAPRITVALRAAQRTAPPVLTGGDARRIVEAARSFPLAELRAAREVPVRVRLIAAVERLLEMAGTLEGAGPAWTALSSEIDARAPRLEADLATYARLSVIDGMSVFAECVLPPATRAELKVSVATAVREGLEVPVTALFGLFARLAPHVSAVTAGLADLIGAIHEKLDLLTGGTGVGGVVDSIEEAADLLRNLDLSPVTDPLDAVFGRLEFAVAAVNPAPLGEALEAAAEAVADLLDLSTIIDAETVAELDAAYAEAVAKLGALSPSAVVADVLDPVYDDLLADVLPLLDLPALLQELLATAQASLGAEVTAQLARVELAFDDMLRALPFGPGAGGVSVSVEVEASASVGTG